MKNNANIHVSKIADAYKAIIGPLAIEFAAYDLAKDKITHELLGLLPQRFIQLRSRYAIQSDRYLADFARFAGFPDAGYRYR